MTIPLSIMRLHGRLEDLGCELRGLVRGESIWNQNDVVLAYRANNIHPWVVWYWTGETLVYGAYCSTEGEAMGEFLHRIQRLRRYAHQNRAERMRETFGESHA